MRKSGTYSPNVDSCVGFSRLSGGERDAKTDEPGIVIDQAQLSLHLPYAVAGDTQPQTAAFYCPFTQVASLIKRLENHVSFGGGDRLAAIGDIDTNLLAAIRSAADAASG